MSARSSLSPLLAFPKLAFRGLLLVLTFTGVMPRMQATVILDEVFPAEARENLDLPGTAAWHSSSSVANITDTTAGELSLATNSSFLVTYFTYDGAAVPLSVGESLSVTFDFSLADITNTPGGFRLGVFNSGGSRTVYDGQGSGNNTYTAYANYTGYAAIMNVGATSGTPMSIRERNKTDNLLITSLSAYTKLSSDGGTASALVSNQTYTGVMTMTRSATATMDISFTVNGLAGFTISRQDTTAPYTEFDSFAIAGMGGAFTSLTLHDFVVATSSGLPVVTGSPVTRAAIEGDTAFMAVAVASDSPVSYQWKYNGSNITGARDSGVYTLTDLVTADAGSYAVAVTNTAGTVESHAAVLTVSVPSPTVTSTRVYPDISGDLVYASDAEGNRVVDFSYAGYHGGDDLLPSVSTVVTLSPIAGDNLSAIQDAIDYVGTLSFQPDGYRGAVLLAAGTYPVSGSILLRHSGVVLAGVGSDFDPAANTIIQRTGTSTVPVILVGGGTDDEFTSEIASTRSDITTSYVPLNAMSFEVDDSSLYLVGQAIIVAQPSTEDWLESIGYGETGDPAEDWLPGEIDLRYHRYITAIDGDTLFIDAPLFNALDRSLAQSYVFRYDATGVVFHAGVDNLAIDIATSGQFSENHAKAAVRYVQAENCWARDVTARRFVQSAILFGGSATRSTAERCRALEPHSIIMGARRYSFNTEGAQLVLFKDCYSANGRHTFVSNGTRLDSGVVFLDSTADFTLHISEGHRRWPQALLFDNITTIHPGFPISYALYNRGIQGTGHGWSAVHSVIWRSDAGGADQRIIVQKPPTAQNYSIGNFGTVTGDNNNSQPAGFIELSNQTEIYPRSLYEGQLDDR